MAAQPGSEDRFVEGWHRVTAAILDACGSFGSRLHRCEDDTWIAYARWPSDEVRRRCFDGPPLDPDGSRMMREAIDEEYDEVRLRVVDDLLRERLRSSRYPQDVFQRKHFREQPVPEITAEPAP